MKELTTFFLSQPEITVGPIAAFSWLSLILGSQKAIESILYAHIITPLPEEVCIEGAGYVLHGSKQYSERHREKFRV